MPSSAWPPPAPVAGRVGGNEMTRAKICLAMASMGLPDTNVAGRAQAAVRGQAEQVSRLWVARVSRRQATPHAGRPVWRVYRASVAGGPNGNLGCTGLRTFVQPTSETDSRP